MVAISHRCNRSPGCLRCRWNSDQRGEPTAVRAMAPRSVQCRFLGADTGERRTCKTCSGKVELKVLSCEVFGRCVVARPQPGMACCAGCSRYQPTA